MKRNFADTTGITFDLIVIGGGIIGANVARDAAMISIQGTAGQEIVANETLVWVATVKHSD